MDFNCVSNCYVFKSRLQEYAQKKGFLTPVYDTVKEGPSHEPCFRSSVIVNDVRYNSLPGFFNRKASEQSAAEVALLELAKAEGATESISYPVHETGLCKNLLQEYAQKMNYAIPNYVCHKGETQERKPLFTCTVDIGGIQYVGAAARSKKEAEIKAARTALLAIQSNSNGAEAKSNGGLQLTVLPGKKKVVETETKKEETKKALKPRRQNLKKKWSNRRKVPRNPTDQVAANVESSLIIKFNQGDENVVNMETISQNGGSTTDMEIVSGAQTSDVVKEAVTAVQEGDEVDHGGEHLAPQLNQTQAVSEAEMENNSMVINFNQGDENVAKMDMSQYGGSITGMEIVSGVQSSDVVNEAVAATQEANKVDHGNEHVAVQLNQGDEDVAKMDNVSQNGGSTMAMDIGCGVQTSEGVNAATEETNKVDHDKEHVAMQVNQTQVVSVAEIDNNSLVIKFNQSDENVAKMDNVSQNGGSPTGQEANKVGHGDEHVAQQLNQTQVSPVVALEVPVVGSESNSVHLNGNEDGRSGSDL